MTHVSAMFPEIQHASERNKKQLYSERITQKRSCLADEIWNEEKLCIFNKFSTEVFGINVSKPLNIKMLFDVISENEAFVFETKHYKELGKLMWGFGIPALKQMRSHCCWKILSNNQVQFDGEFFGVFRNIITVKRKELRKQVNRRMAKYGMKLSQKSIEDQHEIKISYNDNSVFYVTFTEQQSSTKETISTSSHIDTTSGSVRDVLTMEDCDRKIFIDLEKKHGKNKLLQWLSTKENSEVSINDNDHTTISSITMDGNSEKTKYRKCSMNATIVTEDSPVSKNKEKIKEY
jgi:hypothetical protein